jgi:hypothetical protein
MFRIRDVAKFDQNAHQEVAVCIVAFSEIFENMVVHPISCFDPAN